MKIDRAGLPFVVGALFPAALVVLWSPAWALPFISLAGFFAFFFRDPERDVPNDRHIVVSPADGRVVHCPRGRMFGGCGSHNASAWVWGHPADYDAWGYAGNYGWDAATAWTTFKACEDYHRGADDVRGSGGPMPATQLTEPNALAQAFVDGAQQNGGAVDRGVSLGEARQHGKPEDQGQGADQFTTTTLTVESRFGPLRLPAPASESEAIGELRKLAGRNKILRSYLGTGYHVALFCALVARDLDAGRTIRCLYGAALNLDGLCRPIRNPIIDDLTRSTARQ